MPGSLTNLCMGISICVFEFNGLHPELSYRDLHLQSDSILTASIISFVFSLHRELLSDKLLVKD